MSDAHQGLCAQLYQSSLPVLSMHMLQQGLTLTGLPSILYTNPQGCSINVVGQPLLEQKCTLYIPLHWTVYGISENMFLNIGINQH
jgi:hypothetical protein